MTEALSRVLALLFVLALCVWLAIKVAVFLRAFLKPVRDAIRPGLKEAEDRLIAHTAESLRKAGAEPVARGVEGLHAAAQRTEAELGRMLDKAEANAGARTNAK